MKKPRLLDLFCGAGGCTRGYQMAGFEVRGVDINPQKRYIGEEFVQADALEYLEGLIKSGEIFEFSAIHASPPCQAHTSLKSMWNAKRHADLIEPTRVLLQRAALPWVMENVPGAPLGFSILLCGSMFGLGVRDAELRRHRLFESSACLLAPRCQHSGRTIGVYGEGARDSRRKFDKAIPEFTVEDARAAIGAEWMTIAELCQAIPPAYAKFIGEQLIHAIEEKKRPRYSGG